MKFLISIVAILLVSAACNQQPTVSQQNNSDTTAVTTTQSTQTSQQSSESSNQTNDQGQASSATVRIDSLAPTSAAIGAQVAVKGAGFTETDNTINEGGIELTGITSNGTSLVFTVSSCPTYAPRCPGHLLAGPIQISITNANGNSNSVTLNVTE
ncbi:MAG TPA: hypothetical protein VFX17_00865 [Patescibacteria group bacterium]|nr:hypothetical protein [Patescibacteria group bacterium]